MEDICSGWAGSGEGNELWIDPGDQEVDLDVSNRSNTVVESWCAPGRMEANHILCGFRGKLDSPTTGRVARNPV